jgi:hypothetical protein
MKIKFFAVVVVALTVFCVTLASGTVTTFKTGPFTGSIDLGVPCNDLNISKPVQAERLNGYSYTEYVLTACGVIIDFVRYDAPVFASNENLPTTGITSDLLRWGADKDTISVFERKIDGKPGEVGSGYVPKYNLNCYEAGFLESTRTNVNLFLWGNETMMISALKTIHVTESA